MGELWSILRGKFALVVESGTGRMWCSKIVSLFDYNQYEGAK